MKKGLAKRKMNNQKRCLPGVFSFGIVCYRNWEYMKETIKSVLTQDYPRIQLIVSDDGSDNFCIEEFEQYIEDHKSDNLIGYVVRHSEHNEGTVRHLNHVLECVEGEYIMLMAADDVLEDSHVLSTYVEVFNRETEACGVVMGQTALYDVTMTKLLEYYVWPDVIDAVNDSEHSDKLLNKLYFLPVIPTTSVCFRRWVMEKYTPFDTDYYLIEDYPFHIKLAEDHVKMHYENFVAARHRDGGISHGAVTALSKSKRMYYEDCLFARKKVLEKLLKEDGPEELIHFNQFQIASLDKMLLRTGKGLYGFFQYAMKHPGYAMLDICAHASRRRIIKWGFLFVLSLFLYVCMPELALMQIAVFPAVNSEAICSVLEVVCLAFSALIGVIEILELLLLFLARCVL